MNKCSINTSSLDTVLNYDTDSELLAALEASMSDWNVFFNDADVDEKDILLNELRRLQVLKSSGILNLNQKLHLEHLTALTSRIFDVPISLVSIVDLGRLWSASNQGFGDVHETPRISSALCSHAIQSPQDVFVVPDTLNDSRFKNNPLVTGAPYVRFYASSPLTNRDGYKLGNLCIIDVKPHANGLSFKDQQNLVDIAALVMAHIDSKRRYKEENDKFKAETVATTAHDLITPLSAIQLNMELMCDDDELMNRLGEQYKIRLDQTKECVDLLANICQRAIQSYREICITNSTKLVSKDGGDIVDTSKFVSTLEHIMERYPKKVPLTIRIGEDVPRFIESDIISLFRSSINLLTNACKVTTSGFIDLNLHLEPATSVQNPVPMLVFECLDTGPGIEVKDLSHLFSADGGMMLSQKSENSGSGLGLNSVRELITRIGGQFGYKPRDGFSTGSIFWFSVPARMKEPETHKKMYENRSKDHKHNAKEVAGNISGNKHKSEDERLKTPFNLNDFLRGKEITRLHENADMVSTRHPTRTTSTKTSNDPKMDTPICLLVEDCTAVAKAMMNCITRQNWQVYLAQDGKTALELLKSRTWDVVFMDDQLPIISGSTCVVNFRDWEKGNRMSRQNNLFLCSADAHRDDALSLQGFDGILCKPLHMPKLISILKKCSLDRNVIVH